MKKYKYYTGENGVRKRMPIDLASRLNLNYLALTNKTNKVGEFDLPEIVCNTEVFPDYIVGYSNPGNYHKSPNTAVAWYQFDDTFDGIDGLYNAIYYNDKKLLEKYKKRFKGVKFFISPDYSEMGDVDVIENLYRAKKARVVSIWLTVELGAIVIPNITFPRVEDILLYLRGYENCTVVAFSTMCYIDDRKEREYLKEAVKKTVDYLNLKAIVVYDVCKSNDAVYEVFEYAINKGIKIIIPPNNLKVRNAVNKEAV